LDTILSELKRCTRVLVTAHYNPEGDAIGSQLGMYFLLKRLGIPEVVMYDQDPVPLNLCFLEGADLVVTDDPQGAFDAAVVLDSADLGRIGKVAEAVKRAKVVINLDHHISNNDFGNINVVDADASSASELVYRLYKIAFPDIDRAAAYALYTGIATDTGSFMYTCTKPKTHEAAADLIAAGVSPQDVMKNVRASFSFDDLVFVGKVMASLKSDATKRIFWVSCDQWKDDSAGDLTDMIIGNFQCIKGAEVFVIFKRIKGNAVRINLRSRGACDVNVIAKELGGGGHAKAAGATLEGLGMALTEKQVINRITEELARL
jgi:phosphoesterase RecJ-like protein